MRITGGVHRSRTLKAPRGDATRPTSDRVREALFSILGARGAIVGARVLDLYAGTGALGLEALSRGAERAVFVEKSRDAARALRENVDALGVGDAARLVEAPIERAAGEIAKGAPYDLVFADPPYADVPSGVVARALAVALGAGTLADGALVILEHASGDAPPDLAGLSREDSRRYGDTQITLYQPAPVSRAT